MAHKSFILDKVKSYFNLKGNSQLAEFLGVTRQTISNWYSRDSIDYELIITKCTAIDLDIDLKWLLTRTSDKQPVNEQLYNNDNEDEIKKSTDYIISEYDKFQAFAKQLLNEYNYNDKAEKTEALCSKILNIEAYASEFSVMNELRRQYMLLKKEETSMPEIREKLESLISQDSKFYDLVAPYERELNAINAILDLNID